MHRIGIGYDIHRLVKRRKLFLGGINISYTKGLVGHSDADVLIHAICDALLGAAALKDIGEHFPDTDPKYKDISSIKLLKKVVSLLKKSHYSISNIDAVIVAQAPRLTSYKTKMCKKIAQELNLSTRQINVKATSTEGLGPIGKAEAIAAYAVASIKKE